MLVHLVYFIIQPETVSIFNNVLLITGNLGLMYYLVYYYYRHCDIMRIVYIDSINNKIKLHISQHNSQVWKLDGKLRKVQGGPLPANFTYKIA